MSAISGSIFPNRFVWNGRLMTRRALFIVPCNRSDGKRSFYELGQENANVHKNLDQPHCERRSKVGRPLRPPARFIGEGALSHPGTCRLVHYRFLPYITLAYTRSDARRARALFVVKSLLRDRAAPLFGTPKGSDCVCQEWKTMSLNERSNCDPSNHRPPSVDPQTKEGHSLEVDSS